MSTTKGEGCVSWKQIQVLRVLEELGPLTLRQMKEKGVKNAPSSVSALVGRYKLLHRNASTKVYHLNRAGTRFLEKVRGTLKVERTAGKVEDRLKRLEGFVLNLKAAVAVGTVQ